ncbi:hypothetical protein Enr10x_20660 [Gimesia panareensis]|uniref:Uncharacterized protein n=1 Tax=Gimesia panareensis TaxID=2527978 RepID=A0A517Q563_9PLAN|nr:hypothetical protein [Gimesia panareensis]QDT26756.1 hypothetical protein Enr10x_20660 [Gimesia panareensis]
MKGLSLRVLTAAAALGISPLLLSAQLGGVAPDAQLDAGAKAAGKAVQGAGNKGKVGADANAKASGSARTPGLKAPGKGVAPTPPGTKSAGEALDGAKAAGQSQTDANLQNKAKLQKPGGVNLQNKAGLQNKTDANLGDKARLQNKTDAQMQNKMKQMQGKMKMNMRNKMSADGPQRHQTNRPNMDASGKMQMQGQANAQLDPMVREGTAHLDIDDATRARYRYHNGHWWYQTENGQWLIDNNGTWEAFDPVTYRNPRQQMAPPQTYQDDGSANSQSNAGGSYYYDNSPAYGGYYDNGGYSNGYYNSRPYYNN